jgi:pyruvate dehydrogenase E1 component alpha subunit
MLDFREMLFKMQLIRHFEEKVVELFQKGLIRGATHVYLGEEAVAVGACAAIRDDDYITSTHRGHGHVIAKGLDVKRMMAELLGKSTGYCNGKGGSMHIADISRGVLGANGIVGGGLPISVGSGLSSKYKGTGQVTLCFFGDGASNQGSFHESLNLASVWKLPVIYICENNQFAVTTPCCESTAVENIADRAVGYSMPGVVVDGNDVIAVYNTVSEAVERARAGDGPTLIECKTYRWEGHYLGDPQVYRSKEEVAAWKERDPIRRFAEKLLAENVMTLDEIEESDRRARDLIAEAEKFALESPLPSIDSVREGLYAPDVVLPETPIPSGKTKEVTYCQALNEALREELARDPDVVIFGEDVGLHGGAFQVTKNLFHEFGAERVRNTPVSEAAIAGCAVGASLTGLRPVAEIMYIDFSTIASDQIVNQAAKIRYMFGGHATLPLVIRTMCGSGTGSSGQHSQSLEAWYCHIPGLKVVMPSTPYDAKGLLKSAIRDNNPVIFIEWKRLYNYKGMIPVEEYYIPLGVADVKRVGDDVTIIATGAMVLESLSAADELAKEGVSVEVVDPRTLYPLDQETILASVRKTGRVVVVQEAVGRCSFGSEVSAMIMEEAFDYLDAPVKRVSGLDVPMPYSIPLEKAVIPSKEQIIEAVRSIL